MKSIGYLYLVEAYNLSVCDLLLESYLVSESQNKVVRVEGREKRFYAAQRIMVHDSWQDNLLFALKNEGANLEVLKAFFQVCNTTELTQLVASVPTGTYHRRVWFFFELLTGRRLDIDDVATGNYVCAVDERKQFCMPRSSSRRVSRQRICDNLIGDASFCPLVRLTQSISDFPASLLKQKSSDLLSQYPAELLYRAVHYLYIKETRSSFAIELETPGQRRMSAFISTLKGKIPIPMSKDALADIQNKVVDERYAQRDWRTTQVYVGETLTPLHEKVHFIAPRASDLSSLMEGFLASMEKMLIEPECDPVIVAAVMSFAFVFIHPFDDGNGRIHRYLMHYILSRTGFATAGFIFPISAVLLKKPREYDAMLEDFSMRLMEKMSYNMNQNGEISVLGEFADFYRYIDFTPIVEKFQRIISETIETEWKSELDYLVCYDRMRESMRDIVDMPEKQANQFIMFVNQNGGMLSQSKRNFFRELSDEEISKLEVVVRETFRGIYKN